MKQWRKLFLGLFLATMFSGLSFAGTRLCHSRKCDKCVDDFYVKHKTFVSIGIATRHCEIPHKTIDGRKYTTYKCQFGHDILIDLETGKWYNPEK